jgi:hypothetical protein
VSVDLKSVKALRRIGELGAGEWRWFDPYLRGVVEQKKHFGRGGGA